MQTTKLGKQSLSMCLEVNVVSQTNYESTAKAARFQIKIQAKYKIGSEKFTEWQFWLMGSVSMED